MLLMKESVLSFENNNSRTLVFLLSIAYKYKKCGLNSSLANGYAYTVFS